MRSWLLVVAAAASLAACDTGRKPVTADVTPEAWIDRPIYRYGFIPFMRQPDEAPVANTAPGTAAPLQAPPIEIQQERSTRLFGPGLSRRLQLRI